MTETLKQTAQQALVKLEKLRVTIDSEWGQCRELDQIEIDGDQWQEVIDLRAALAEQQAKDHKDRLIEQLEETVLWQAKRIAQLLDEPQPAKREPLTNADLKQVINAAPTPLNPHDVGRWVVNVCRAIEAAHGITGQPQPRREVELTDDAITHMAAQSLLYEETPPQGFDAAVRSFARAVIEAYKEKNT